MRRRYLSWFASCSCLLLLLLFGCRYGDKNATPLAPDYAATTAQGVPVTIAVLARATDVDGDRLTVVSVTQGAAGEVTLNRDGTATYTPGEGFSGSDSFRYTIDDDHGAQAAGRVTVTVLPLPGMVVGAHSTPSANSSRPDSWMPSLGKSMTVGRSLALVWFRMAGSCRDFSMSMTASPSLTCRLPSAEPSASTITVQS